MTIPVMTIATSSKIRSVVKRLDIRNRKIRVYWKMDMDRRVRDVPKNATEIYNMVFGAGTK